MVEEHNLTVEDARTKDERTFGFPVEFKKAKLRIHGIATAGLKITSINLFYMMGKYRR